jgi:hypothetical protein
MDQAQPWVYAVHMDAPLVADLDGAALKLTLVGTDGGEEQHDAEIAVFTNKDRPRQASVQVTLNRPGSLKDRYIQTTGFLDQPTVASILRASPDETPSLRASESMAGGARVLRAVTSAQAPK